MIKLILGDCLEKMKEMEDGSIDMVITDPPYSRNTITAHSRNGVRNLADLSIQEFFYSEMYKEIARMLKDGGVAFTFCDDLFYPILFATSYNYMQGHSLITWDKGQISFGRPIRKKHELIMYCSKGGGGQFYASEERTHFPSIIAHNKERNKQHDAQKPIEVIEDLIKHFSKENSIILDHFMGSGTTGLACKNLNRNFIGIELDENYFKIAQERINNTPDKLI